MKRATWAVALMLGLAAPEAGRADEMLLGVNAAVDYDSNVVTSADGRRRNGWSFRGGPQAELRREHGRFRYNGRYNAFYERIVDPDVGDEDSWDHIARGRGSWTITPQTTVRFLDNYSRTERPTFLVNSVDNTGQTEVDTGTRRITDNFAEISFEHAFEPQWMGSLTARHSFRRFSSDQLFNSQSVGGEAALHYQWRPQDRFEGGVGYSYTNVDGRQGSPGSRTQTTEIFAGFSHHFDPTLRVDLRGGPGVVYTETKELSAPSAPPPGVILPPSTIGGEDETRVNFFAQGGIDKQWGSVTTSLFYRRTERPSSGSSSATTADNLVGLLVWRPGYRWRFHLRGTWTRQVSISEIERFQPQISNGAISLVEDSNTAVDLIQWTLSAVASYRINEHSSTAFELRYSRQDEDGDASSLSSAERLFAVIRFNYNLDPIQF